ncbi:MAG: hypothetical protein Solivirus1_14 [Solivirus sp.]|uniref:Uncharacterized protein n=1 Tax=Solivirus sp. TaxID=2487772 RepID=A0A3G5AFA2_9VIRU|nr:MAG: hypothetical protein Solivirus1_14 [Solivirus sp.]
MDFANLLIQNEKESKIAWSPSCSFEVSTNKYIYGPIGRISPCSGEAKELPVWKYVLPTALRVDISSENEKIIEQLHDLIKGDKNLDIEYKNREITHISFRVKDEFKEEVEKFEQNEKERDAKIQKLIAELRELDFHIGDSYCDREPLFPNEWREIERVTYGPAHLNISCHSQTEIYKALEDAGVLDKYCPEWYRNGNF